MNVLSRNYCRHVCTSRVLAGIPDICNVPAGSDLRRFRQLQVQADDVLTGINRDGHAVSGVQRITREGAGVPEIRLAPTEKVICYEIIRSTISTMDKRSVVKYIRDRQACHRYSREEGKTGVSTDITSCLENEITVWRRREDNILHKVDVPCCLYIYISRQEIIRCFLDSLPRLRSIRRIKRYIS